MEENKDDEKNVWKKKEIEKLVKNIMLFLLMILVSIFIINFHRSTSAQKEEKEVDFSGINKICELSTLRCYYHNVAKEEIDASGPFAKWFKTGYKKIWTEYSGIIEYGIDVSKVEVSEPDKDGVVTITIPEAEVLNVDVDESSMSKPLTDTGFFTTITKEEETATLSGAQSDMEEMAKDNTELLTKAKTRAKTLLEEYIKNVGEGIGESYTVEWKDAE